jgi:predicted amidohydrolase
LAGRLEALGGERLFAAVVGLGKAVQESLPPYENLVNASAGEWTEEDGGALNTYRLPVRAVYPRPSAPGPAGSAGERHRTGSAFKQYLDTTPQGRVTERKVRGVHVDGLFERFLVVDQTYYRADVNPKHYWNRWLRLDRVVRRGGSMRDLRVAGSCLVRTLAPGALVRLPTAPDGTFHVRDSDGDETPALLRFLEGACAKGTHLIALPELTVSADGEAAAATFLKELPDERKPCLVVLGSRHETYADGSRRNVASVLDGNGDLLWRHEKLHPAQVSLGRTADGKRAAPLLEDIVPGPLGTVVFRDTPLGRICVVICADIDQTDLGEFVGSLAPDIVLVPTMNPGRQRTSLFPVCADTIPKRTAALVASVNTCAAKRVDRETEELDEKDRRDVSFVYCPIAAGERATRWLHCEDDPEQCLFVVSVGDFPVAGGANGSGWPPLQGDRPPLP